MCCKGYSQALVVGHILHFVALLSHVVGSFLPMFEKYDDRQLGLALNCTRNVVNDDWSCRTFTIQEWQDLSAWRKACLGTAMSGILLYLVMIILLFATYCKCGSKTCSIFVGVLFGLLAVAASASTGAVWWYMRGFHGAISIALIIAAAGAELVVVFCLLLALCGPCRVKHTSDYY